MKKESTNYSILNKKDFPNFFNALLKNYDIFGPSKFDKGDGLGKITCAEDLVLDFKNFKMPLKGFFLPQCEAILVFDIDTGIINDAPETANEKDNLIIGIRPCDAMAIALVDRVFKESEPQDPYYTDKRRRTTIISIACLEPEPTCFCNSAGCDVNSEAGADVILFQLNNRYLIKRLSEKGGEILKYVKTLTPATEDDILEKDQSIVRAKNQLAEDLKAKELTGKLDNFDASFWQAVHQKCIGCGVCTYICPTCHCFDLTDEVNNNTGRRIRTWDSCMFPLFTQHASGHNPRPGLKERMRQRIMHKFNYTLKNYNELFCVGCGRCIVNCPVNLDIRKVIKEIGEAVAK